MKGLFALQLAPRSTRLLGALAAMGAILAQGAPPGYFVTPSAAPNGDGSRSRPFQSLGQARDGLRAARRAGIIASGKPTIVYLDPGEHRLESTFELTGDLDEASARFSSRFRSCVAGGIR